jgi:hypothetical protein
VNRITQRYQVKQVSPQQTMKGQPPGLLLIADDVIENVGDLLHLLTTGDGTSRATWVVAVQVSLPGTADVGLRRWTAVYRSF